MYPLTCARAIRSIDRTSGSGRQHSSRVPWRSIVEAWGCVRQNITKLNTKLKLRFIQDSSIWGSLSVANPMPKAQAFVDLVRRHPGRPILAAPTIFLLRGRQLCSIWQRPWAWRHTPSIPYRLSPWPRRSYHPSPLSLVLALQRRSTTASTVELNPSGGRPHPTRAEEIAIGERGFRRVTFSVKAI
jgi:hypothetical protein